MVENSAEGLVMLAPGATVNVTGEERHQTLLARYRPGATVAVELRRGERGIEVVLDGRRIGELTPLMSQRYGPALARLIANGGRPGCEANIRAGARGLEMTLRLPKNPDAELPVVANSGEGPTMALKPVSAPVQRKGLARPLWIAAAAFVLVLFLVMITNGEDESSPVAGDVTTTTPAPTTTTTAPPPPTTTTPPPPPPPPPPKPQPVPTTEPPPPPPPPEPKPEPEPEPGPACDPNYSGCVPVASDVDCAGGDGNGPAYAEGPVQVVGSDIYDLDRDGDGTACDS